MDIVLTRTASLDGNVPQPRNRKTSLSHGSKRFSPPPSQLTKQEKPKAGDGSHVETADVVIVGAGIAGCAAAVAFGRQGRRVILLERSLKEPERVVGELLQPGGVRALKALGLGDCLEGIDAVPCYGYHVSYYKETVMIPYPMLEGQTSRPEGRAFHHGRFVMKLRDAARRCPNVTIVEAKVTETIEEESGKVVGVVAKSTSAPTTTSTSTSSSSTSTTVTGTSTTTTTKQKYHAPLTLITDGYASTFRKSYLPPTHPAPVARSKFYALTLQTPPGSSILPSPGHGHVVLSDIPPLLIYQISSTITRLFVDIPSSHPISVKDHLTENVLPQLPESVHQPFLAAVQEGRIRSMPNSFLPSPSSQGDRVKGVVVLGDAMNMRHPLTGGGMTVAFNDVLLLADLLAPGRVPELGDLGRVGEMVGRFCRERKNGRLVDELASGVKEEVEDEGDGVEGIVRESSSSGQVWGGGASVINILAMALYALFAADDEMLAILKNGCFRYFQLGGACVDEPCGMLAGLISRPFTLVWHFFSVVAYAIWLRMGEVELWRKPYVLFVESVLVLWKAICVIGPYLYWEMRS